jgi:MarR family transcriptional regulator, transcriptional regulator for hemolysin
MGTKLLECIGPQIKLTSNVMAVEHNKYLRSSGISSEQGLFLKFVLDFPGSTQTQLAELLHKDKTTVTRMIDILEKKNMLYRKACPNDRRVYQIYVTEKTTQQVEALTPLFERRSEELREIITPEEQEITLRVLKKIQNYYRGLNK